MGKFHTKGIGELSALQVVSELQIENGTIARIEAGGCVSDQRGQLFLLSACPQVNIVNEAGEVINGYGLVPHATQTFVARNGVEPWTELCRVTELTDTFSCEQERFLNGIGCIVW
jgi:hypothetical protein